jgi:membrane associated rhomboid family serine protease
MEKLTGYNESNEKPADVQRGPILTWIVCAACVAIFVDVSQGKSQISDTLFYLTSTGIRSGNYRGLLTSVFTHVQLWHLFFNVYWLWILGGLLESAIGRLNWTGFFLVAAFVSSGAQFATSGSTGIGASGVVYAMFGFMWIGRERYPGFQRIVTKQNLLLFLGWLIFCIIATRLNIFRVGNAAHVAGLLFGAGVAFLVLKNKAGAFQPEQQRQ